MHKLWSENPEKACDLNAFSMFSQLNDGGTDFFLDKEEFEEFMTVVLEMNFLSGEDKSLFEQKA